MHAVRLALALCHDGSSMHMTDMLLEKAEIAVQHAPALQILQRNTLRICDKSVLLSFFEGSKKVDNDVAPEVTIDEGLKPEDGAICHKVKANAHWNHGSHVLHNVMSTETQVAKR
jgi:hypothetical protein